MYPSILWSLNYALAVDWLLLSIKLLPFLPPGISKIYSLPFAIAACPKILPVLVAFVINMSPDRIEGFALLFYFLESGGITISSNIWRFTFENCS